MDASSEGRVVRHGETMLPQVEVRSYSLPLREGDAFLGDLASGSEFRKVLRRERHRVEDRSDPPFGHDRTHELDGEDLDAALQERNSTPEGRIVDKAIATFSEHFAAVLDKFLDTAEWRGIQRVVCGGGLMEGDVGTELVRRTQRLMCEDRPDIELLRLHHAPDDAGMIGWTYAAPHEALSGADAFVALDIGGTNVRWGIVRIDRSLPDAEAATVVRHEKWCHANETVGRDAVVDKIGAGIAEMVQVAASDGLKLAPLVGLSCPGIVRPDGRLSSGGQNLPGDWSDGVFSLPQEVSERVGMIAGRSPFVVLHNDAVIQALSELPRVRDLETWAAVTLGTGFGNCSFRNRG